MDARSLFTLRQTATCGAAQFDRTRACRRGGFFFADVVVGLALIALLIGGLLVIVTGQQRQSLRLSNMRAASRAAEATLTALQTSRSPRPAPDEAVQVRKLTADVAPEGKAWVEVTASVRGRSVALEGIVPDGPALRDAAGAYAATRPVMPATQPAAGRGEAP